MKTHYTLLFLMICLISQGHTEGLLSERYHTYEEIQAQLAVWETEFGENPNPSGAYPGSGIIYHLEEIGYSTQDNLPFNAVRLSYDADTDSDKPKVLFLGQCHAEEIFGVEITMELIRRFLYPTPQYPIQNMRAILESSEVWIVPTHNPEGLQVVHGFESDTGFVQDVSYRKNKQDVNQNGFFDFLVGVGNDSDGVDLNRNFDFNWFFGDGPYVEDNAGGNYQSHFDYYKGAYPFSETEVQALRDFAIGKQFLLSIAYHSSRSGNVSEKVIFPWMWAAGKTSPDYSIISTLGIDIAHFIPKEAGVGYYSPIPGLSRKGNAHDWFYTETGCIQYLIETGTENMQPQDTTLIEGTIERSLRGAFHLMNRSIGYGQGEFAADAYQVTGIVTDENTGLAIVGAIIEIEELNGPMLKPRKTDAFGRYRRLLSQGTFTLNISAPGYEAISEDISPSSVALLEVNHALTPLPAHTLTLQISATDTSIQSFSVFIQDGYSTDTLEVLEGENSFTYPENQYSLQINNPAILPVFRSFTLTQDSTILILTENRELLYHETFTDLGDWTIESGGWVIENEALSSQAELIYPNSSSAISSKQIHLTEDTLLVLSLDWQYEVEWEHDIITIEILGNTDTTTFIWDNQHWDNHEEHLPIITDSDSIKIAIHLQPDNTLGYRGIRIYSLSLLSTSETAHNEPEDVLLPAFFVLPPYPNPFNPITHITYRLPNQAHVTADIYNMLGQVVETLASGQQTAGEKHLVWNAESQSSGIYFIRITADQQSSTQKIVLLK